MRNENRFFVERKSVSTKEKDNGPSTFLTTATNRSDCYLSFLSYLHKYYCSALLMQKHARIIKGHFSERRVLICLIIRSEDFFLFSRDTERPKQRTFRILSEPHCTSSITMCLKIYFLVVSY